MHTILIILICINIFLVISLFYGMTNIYKDDTLPKTRAFYSIFLSVLMFLYLALILIAGVKYLMMSKYQASPFLFMFFVLPFAIGNFASYNKLKLFTFIQIAIFILSLIYFIYLYVKL